jgi:hypothetical protein
MDTLFTSESKQSREYSLRGLFSLQNSGERALYRRSQIDKISRLAERKIADLVFESERLGTSECGHVEQVSRFEMEAVWGEPL